MGGKQSSALGFEDMTGVTVDNDLDLRNINDELASLFKFKAWNGIARHCTAPIARVLTLCDVLYC